MKKLLLLLFIFGCSILCKAQNGIYRDSVYADGTRAIQTMYYSYTNLLDDPAVFIGLTESIKKDNCYLQLNVQVCRSYEIGDIPKNGRLLIKYDKDSIMELRASARYEQERIRNQYRIIASYPISISQMMKLTIDVKKIRLETVQGNITLDIDPRLSTAAMTNIMKALSNHNKKNNSDGFRDDF